MTEPNLITFSLSKKRIARFWSKTQLNPATGCLEWQGIKNNKGYGTIHLFANRHILTHRLAYFLYHGVDPERMRVCHSCDNPLCLSAEHLFLGSQQDNLSDMTKKGRRAFGKKITENRDEARGERHGNAKLTEKQVLEIRARYIPNKVSQGSLAKEFMVSQRLIHVIIHRKIWTHI